MSHAKLQSAPVSQTEENSGYRLVAEPFTDQEWDRAVAGYPTATSFHTSSWLRLLEELTGGHPVRLRIEGPRGALGFFAAVRIRKGPFTILGSPMRGWGTPNMGPVANPGEFETGEFLAALDGYCRENKVDFVEMCCDWLDAAVLEQRGFRALRDVTHSIELKSKDEAWSQLYKTTRNYVRRAEKNGVRVERVYGEEVIREHYDQLQAVFAKQNLTPPYGVERPLAMRRRLPDSEFITLRAVHEGRGVATYLLSYDTHAMWGLATASWPEALELRPNELIHWHAIAMACDMGLTRYDLCGGGDYKKKYGAVEIPRIRWIKAYSAMAGLGYRAAERGWELKRKVTKFLKKGRSK